MDYLKNIQVVHQYFENYMFKYTQNYRVSGPCPLSWSLLENAPFWKLDLFSFSGEGRKTPTLLDPLEKANFKSITGPVIEVRSF
jgi:hypothetical protein